MDSPSWNFCGVDLRLSLSGITIGTLRKIFDPGKMEPMVVATGNPLIL